MTNSHKFNTRVNQLGFGSPSASLVLEHVELEPLALGKVRVQIEATNINPSDRLSIQGVGQYRRTHVPPRVPGFEAVGRVVEINDPHQTEFHIGQKVLVAAAYNAGWQKVLDWLPRDEPMPMDVWIDNIPFKETREYVKAVLAYHQIYEWQLGEKSELFAQVSNMQVPVYAP